MGGGERREWKKEVGSFTAMAAVEVAMVIINTLYKAASTKGLSYSVFISYSYLIGTLTLLPLPLICPRREAIPPFTTSIFFKIVISAIVGILANVSGYKGVEYSSPALASAIGNLTPAFTFILALIFRLEKLELRNSTKQIKIMGTLLSISGAMVAVLYQGPAVLSLGSSLTSSSLSSSSSLSLSSPSFMLKTAQTNWIIGGVLLILLCFFLSLWYILQGQIMKVYPDERAVALFYFVCKTIIWVPICVATESNSIDQWKLRPDIALVTVVFAGLFGPSFQTFLNTWVVHLKGPLYASIFTPFSVAIAATIGIIFLGDTLFLGSIVGTIILLLGFYAVIWATAQEDKENKDCGSDSPHGKIPLLQNNIDLEKENM